MATPHQPWEISIEGVVLREGDRLLLEDPEYKYGAGPLHLKVLILHDREVWGGATWVRVAGLDLEYVDPQPRSATVLVSAIPVARQRSKHRPTPWVRTEPTGSALYRSSHADPKRG